MESLTSLILLSLAHEANTPQAIARAKVRGKFNRPIQAVQSLLILLETNQDRGLFRIEVRRTRTYLDSSLNVFQSPL